MATFKFIGGVPHIDLSGLKPGDEKAYVVKWPDGTRRQFEVRVTGHTTTRLAELKIEREQSATQRTTLAAKFTTAAADAQAAIDLVNDGDFVER